MSSGGTEGGQRRRYLRARLLESDKTLTANIYTHWLISCSMAAGVCVCVCVSNKGRESGQRCPTAGHVVDDDATAVQVESSRPVVQLTLRLVRRAVRAVVVTIGTVGRAAAPTAS